MAGCVPCFVIPLLLFIFHRYIQPIVLKFWNPWETKQIKEQPKNEEKPKLNTEESQLEQSDKKNS